MVAPVAAAAPPCALFARCSLHQPAQLLLSRPVPLGLAAARGRPQVGLQLGLGRGCLGRWACVVMRALRCSTGCRLLYADQ